MSVEAISIAVVFRHFKWKRFKSLLCLDTSCAWKRFKSLLCLDTSCAWKRFKSLLGGEKIYQISSSAVSITFGCHRIFSSDCMAIQWFRKEFIKIYENDIPKILAEEPERWDKVGPVTAKRLTEVWC